MYFFPQFFRNIAVVEEIVTEQELLLTGHESNFFFHPTNGLLAVVDRMGASVSIYSHNSRDWPIYERRVKTYNKSIALKTVEL